MQKINEFIGKFTDWYMTSYSNTNREAFKAALRKAILTELPSRNNLLWVQIRDIEIDDKYRRLKNIDTAINAGKLEVISYSSKPTSERCFRTKYD